MNQLSFIDVHYRYKGKKEEALKGVSFTLNQGERLALIGKNGSGKSTLILQANGILRPYKGKILINQKELRYDHQSLLELRRQVGVVFQNPDEQLFSASVLQDLSFGALNLGLSAAQAEQRVREIAELCGCTHLLDSPTFALSGGEKALIALAGILVMKPNFLFADELLGSLDVWMQERILSIFDRLLAEGMCIVLATHDFNFVARWAQRVIYLQDGAVFCQGKPDEVFSHVSIPSFVFNNWELGVYSYD